ARTMLAARRDLEIFPLAVAWQPDLSLAEQVRVLDVPWDYLEREVQDRGAYLLVLRLDHPRAVETGSLGLITFQPGYYVYTGSAMANLPARIGRHLRRRKTMHWHIDYLREAADTVKALPVRTSQRIEEPLAKALSGILSAGPSGFGASDSSQATHLIYSATDPMQDRRFHDVLQSFRMRAPNE
ncbi:MAG: GIY-YIG nuclease family protein, partial [Chloroflexi bacterium]|nr:GIY-YIG nuclease family protein [Chloroflexota bacterium]